MHQVCLAFVQLGQCGQRLKDKLQNKDKVEVENISQSQEKKVCDLRESLILDHWYTCQHDTGFRAVVSAKLTKGSGFEGLRELVEP